MTTTLRRRTRGAEATGGAPSAPAAARSRRSGWRSPRLALGVLLVAGCVVAGARLVAAADDTVAVWATATELPAGAVVGSDDLERRQVRFPDDETAAAYVSASTPLAADSRVVRDVSAGELLPQDALTAGPVEALLEVPLSVAADDLPATVRQGSVVDVWVTADPALADGDGEGATRVLEAVEVVAVPSGGDTLAPQQTRQVILGVPQDRTEQLGAALAAWAQGRVVVARRG
jgi:hypothetical protein